MSFYKQPFFLVLVFAATFLCSCGTTGQYISQQRALRPFNAIEISGAVDLFVTIGPRYSCTITGNENIVYSFQTDVRRQKLYIRAEAPYLPSRNLVVHVETPTFESLSVSLSGNINAHIDGSLENLLLQTKGIGVLNVEGIDAKQLVLNIHGGGRATLLGTADQVVVTLSGVGKAQLDELCASHVDATVNGTGQIQVNPANRLNATINGTGAITYYGKPNVNPTINGTGRIRALNRFNDCASVFDIEQRP